MPREVTFLRLFWCSVPCSLRKLTGSRTIMRRLRSTWSKFHWAVKSPSVLQPCAVAAHRYLRVRPSPVVRCFLLIWFLVLLLFLSGGLLLFFIIFLCHLVVRVVIVGSIYRLPVLILPNNHIVVSPGHGLKELASGCIFHVRRTRERPAQVTGWQVTRSNSNNDAVP